MTGDGSKQGIDALDGLIELPRRIDRGDVSRPTEPSEHLIATGA